jgi:hypothetical protein
MTILKILIGLLIGGDCAAKNISRVDDHDIFKILDDAEPLGLLLDRSELVSAMRIIKSSASFRLNGLQGPPGSTE